MVGARIGGSPLVGGGKYALKQDHVLTEVPRAEEQVAHAQPRGFAHPLGTVRVAEQPADALPEAAEIPRLDEVAGTAVLDLVLDAAGRRGNDGPPLPHRLGHGQAEALGEALLGHDVGARAGAR